MSAIIACASLLLCSKMFAKTQFTDALTITLVFGAYLTQLVAPYLLYYNLSLFWLSGAIVLSDSGANQLLTQLRKPIVSSWVIDNPYLVLVLASAIIPPHSLLELPLLLSFPALCLWLWTFKLTFDACQNH